jgi:hypothetical protein
VALLHYFTIYRTKCGCLCLSYIYIVYRPQMIVTLIFQTKTNSHMLIDYIDQKTTFIVLLMANLFKLFGFPIFRYRTKFDS